MSRSPLKRAGVRALLAAGLLTTVFAAGVATAISLYPRLTAEVDEHDADHATDEKSPEDPDNPTHEDEEPHVALTEQAVANLDLHMGPVSRGDFWKTLLVPGRVVEIPGRSDLSVPAPVTGVIEEVQVLPGETLSPTKSMFAIRLTDEALLDAQSKLLETLTRREVAEQEVTRLSSLVASGVIPGAKKRELNYQLRQLEAQQSTLMQELRGRGLPQSMIDALMKGRKLASTLPVYPPNFITPADSGAQPRTKAKESSTGFSVEHLLGHPGKFVSRGQPLCTVAYHTKLYLEGTAFEDDLPVLDRIAENRWQITVESHGHTEDPLNALRLDLLRVDNHIDERTQTVKFFLELPNEVTQIRHVEGRTFRQWRFRPGQRLHLRLPVERWEDQLTLPADAVVVDGLKVFVFAEDRHGEPLQQPTSAQSRYQSSASTEPTDSELPDHHQEEDVSLDLEPIPVRLLYRDDQTAVIGDDGQFPPSTRIALNNAYKLYLAMKMRHSGEGHPHHDH